LQLGEPDLVVAQKVAGDITRRISDFGKMVCKMKLFIREGDHWAYMEGDSTFHVEL